MDTQYANDFDTLSRLVDIKGAMGIIEHLLGRTGADAYTALASQNIIYIGGGGSIVGNGGNLFSQVNDLADLSALSRTEQLVKLKEMGFKQ